jgi:response regulator NasT
LIASTRAVIDANVMHVLTGGEGRVTAAPVARDTTRLLIVADDPRAAARLRGVLVGAGFEVHGPAADRCQAVAVAAVVRPDLVVLDVGSPDTDVPAVIREIGDRTAAPMVLLLTPPVQSALNERAVDAAAVACLVTPFVQSTLLTAVELLLARSAEHDAGTAAALTRRLQDRNLVERAKALLMLHQQMTEAEAHRWLQRASMHRRTKMTRVAASVIDRGGRGPAGARAGGGDEAVEAHQADAVPVVSERVSAQAGDQTWINDDPLELDDITEVPSSIGAEAVKPVCPSRPPNIDAL